MKIVLAVLLCCCLFVVVITPAGAACTAVTSLPQTLMSGSWCLAGNLTMDVKDPNPAIIIGADDVVFDLSGYEIRSSDLGKGTGISQKGARKNVSIKNGSISGFYSNIFMDRSDNRNIVIEGITSSGTNDGANVNGHGVVIRNSRFTGDDERCSAVYAMGKDLKIINNDIVSSGRLCGNYIYVEAEPAGTDGSITVENNRVSSSAVREGTIGIEVSSGNASVLNNSLQNMETGIVFQAGAKGKYSGNKMINCTKPIIVHEGVIDGGKNVIAKEVPQ